MADPPRRSLRESAIRAWRNEFDLSIVVTPSGVPLLSRSRLRLGMDLGVTAKYCPP